MLKEKLAKYNIILASGSPRRQQFFRDLNLEFEIRLKEVDEIFPDHFKEVQITDFLADLKSKAFDNELKDNDILITSDTIVWLNDKALGKPKDYDDAFNMLKSLSNRSHKVITSVSIKGKNFQKILHDTSLVNFRELTNEEIHYYIENYEPFDKAGAYGIQDWIGKIGINKIEGSYFNVMGLPVHKLYKELENL
ncbi:Maf family nucleotide pyrophosphatase [Tenacibaculum sp. ZS6-P6]|uniref:Maf family nucleotide pyrophosphatase n=1 Tax=Tenacibaculum sp. ZS6-P6 TaxID=3447503 RepID=UPI003F96E352